MSRRATSRGPRAAPESGPEPPLLGTEGGRPAPRWHRGRRDGRGGRGRAEGGGCGRLPPSLPSSEAAGRSVTNLRPPSPTQPYRLPHGGASPRPHGASPGSRPLLGEAPRRRPPRGRRSNTAGGLRWVRPGRREAAALAELRAGAWPGCRQVPVRGSSRPLPPGRDGTARHRTGPDGEPGTAVRDGRAGPGRTQAWSRAPPPQAPSDGRERDPSPPCEAFRRGCLCRGARRVRVVCRVPRRTSAPLKADVTLSSSSGAKGAVGRCPCPTLSLSHALPSHRCYLRLFILAIFPFFFFLHGASTENSYSGKPFIGLGGCFCSQVCLVWVRAGSALSSACYSGLTTLGAQPSAAGPPSSFPAGGTAAFGMRGVHGEQALLNCFLLGQLWLTHGCNWFCLLQDFLQTCSRQSHAVDDFVLTVHKSLNNRTVSVRM